MAEVSIVDYGIGNIGSITNMFRKLRVESEIVSSRASLLGAKRLILPGIGAFDACMRALDNSGLRAAVLEFAATQRQMLGICVGMQMLALDSEEGDMPGLGLIRAHARRIPGAEGLRIPHMGWNTVKWLVPGHPLANELSNDSRFYFVHSFQGHMRITREFPCDLYLRRGFFRCNRQRKYCGGAVPPGEESSIRTAAFE